MKTLGGIGAVIGALLLLYAMAMNTTVSTGFGAVHNIGLLQQQQTFTQTALAIIVVSIGLLAFGALQRANATTADEVGNRVECPECAEKIARNAKKCRFCGANLAKAATAECAYCDQLVMKPSVPCSSRNQTDLKAAFGSMENLECAAALMAQGIVEDDDQA